MHIVVSISTINVPTNVMGLAANIAEHGHIDTVQIVVTGDVKTPRATSIYLAEVAQRTGVSILYLDMQGQRDYLLPQFGDLLDWLPENSICRKNIGTLHAVLHCADAVLLMDDDCEVLPDHGDFIGQHVEALQTQKGARWQAGGFYNPLGGHGRHRGLPTTEKTIGYVPRNNRSVRIWVNEGLWLGEPDIDAVDRRLDRTFWESCPSSRAVVNAYTPIDGQNTLIHRDLFPLCFLTPDLGRSDDIWMGYSMCRVMMEHNVGVRYGTPVVGHFQWRTRASIEADVASEALTTPLHSSFCEALDSLELTGNAQDMACAIAGFMQDHPEEMFRNFGIGLGVWLNTLDQI